MGTLSTQLLVDKLEKLQSTQQSIEGLSTWCMFYKKEVKKIVATWDVQFQKAAPDRRLSFMYLANDLLQNGRKKSAELCGEFFRVLPRALKTISKDNPPKDVERMKRLVSVWRERLVYSPNATKQLLDSLDEAGAEGHTDSAKDGEPASKRVKASYGATVSIDAAPEVAFAQSMVTNVAENLEVDGTMAELKAAEIPLKSYAESLEREIAARKLAVTTLKSLLADQEKGLAGAEQKLQLSKQHLNKVKSRMDILHKQPQTPPASTPDKTTLPAAAAAPVPPLDEALAGGDEYDPENP